MIVVIDYSGSFSHLIAHSLRELGGEVELLKSADATRQTIDALSPHALVLTPGDRHPSEMELERQLLLSYGGRLPVLGISTGGQLLATAFGAEVVAAPPQHGKVLEVRSDGDGIFSTLFRPFKAMCYHSLVLDEATLPPELVVSARSALGEVMAIRHSSLPLNGLMFHPESVMTPMGKRIFRNFLLQIEQHERLKGGV